MVVRWCRVVKDNAMDEWLPVTRAIQDGMLCALRFRDQSGFVDRPGPYVYQANRWWYLVNPALRVREKPTHFKPLVPSRA